MDNVSGWLDGFSGFTSQIVQAVAAYLPSLLGAAVLLAIGWLVARVLRYATLGVGDGANRVLERYLRMRALARMRLSPRVVKLVADVVFWLVVLFFVTAATRVARLETFSSWLDGIVEYLPTLLAGGLILLAGYILSTLVRDAVAATTAAVRLGQSELFGLVAQALTLVAAAILGISQIGIDVTFLVTVTAVVLGMFLAGISLAFGLGARSLVADLIGAHYLQHWLQPGQTARIGDIEGDVLEVNATNVVLATAEGRTTVPARLFSEQPSVVISPVRSDE